jgi:hypothetical protein
MNSQQIPNQLRIKFQLSLSLKGFQKASLLDAHIEASLEASLS